MGQEIYKEPRGFRVEGSGFWNTILHFWGPVIKAVLGMRGVWGLGLKVFVHDTVVLRGFGDIMGL